MFEECVGVCSQGSVVLMLRIQDQHYTWVPISLNSGLSRSLENRVPPRLYSSVPPKVRVHTSFVCRQKVSSLTLSAFIPPNVAFKNVYITL